jgi:hypothetical protein
MIINQKGWFCHNYVELANGNRYQLCFYDLGRLSQHLQDNANEGNPFFIEVALIIVSEITIENMEKAVRAAYGQKFFDTLIPIRS